MNLPDIQRRMIHQIISTLYGDFRAAKERKKERSRKEFRTHKLKKAGGYTVCSEGKYELPRASGQEKGRKSLANKENQTERNPAADFIFS